MHEKESLEQELSELALCGTIGFISIKKVFILCSWEHVHGNVCIPRTFNTSLVSATTALFWFKLWHAKNSGEGGMPLRVHNHLPIETVQGTSEQ